MMNDANNENMTIASVGCAPGGRIPSRKKGGADLVGIRKVIFDHSKMAGLTLADLSRAAGKNTAYIHQYLFKETPKRLDEDTRIIVSNLLGLDADQLRDFPVRMPMLTREQGIEPRPSGQSASQGIPLFRETEIIDFTKTTRRVAGIPTQGAPVTLAVWIEHPRKKFGPGDIVFATPDHPVRPTDLVVVVSENRVTCLGEVHAVGATSITVESLSQPEEFERADVAIWKIVGVAYP